MGRIAFVTDSTANLTVEQAARAGVTVVPLTVVFGNQAYREGIDLTTEDFYEMLAKATTLPTTSQPSVGEFANVFRSLLNDSDEVLCYLLSSRLSGTLRAAEAAAQMVDPERIHVIDSLYASYGIAGPLLDGVALARAGYGAAAIIDWWECVRTQVRSVFVLDTLEYLHRGGRIGGAAAVLGSLLQIKPLLTVKDGQLGLLDKVRTHRRAVERMLFEFAQDTGQGGLWRACVVHARRAEEAMALRQQLAAQFPQIAFAVSELGPVIGTHTGPGVLALVYYPAPAGLAGAAG
ncbi:MAG: DegV family protein [Alicyclobacillus sp.]|nr:DegV family protein [Alicyclobacillus sp.]